MILPKDLDDRVVNAIDRVGIGGGFPSSNQFDERGVLVPGERARSEQILDPPWQEGEDGGLEAPAFQLREKIPRWLQVHADAHVLQLVLDVDRRRQTLRSAGMSERREAKRPAIAQADAVAAPFAPARGVEEGASLCRTYGNGSGRWPR